VRGMLGFTGLYKGRRVSVQGTGMGIPSISIYAHELLAEYGAKRLIRIGTCGALQADIKLGDVLLALAASTDSATNRRRFGGADFAPAASFELLAKTYEIARARRLQVRVGTVLTGDLFYGDDPDFWKLSAGFGAQALSILTASDSLVTGATATTEERQQGYTAMMELALEAAIA
jgi:purine-nucleoside phosphorylase